MATAQEWKERLDLAELPDDEFLASLNALEGQDVVQASGEELLSRGLAVEMSPAQLVEEVDRAFIADSVGALLAALRTYRAVTLQHVGEQMGVGRARVSHLEGGENAKLDTVARYAAALGYRARLVLEPQENQEGPTFQLPLALLGEGQDESRGRAERR